MTAHTSSDPCSRRPSVNRSFALACIALGAFGALVAPVSAQRPALDARLDARLDERLDSLVGLVSTDRRLAGLAVSVRRGTAYAYSRSIGVVRSPDGDGIGPAHAFRIASITKQFVAAAILRLEERGALNLDDPALRHLRVPPALAALLTDVTVRQLLAHTSGLVNYTDLITDFSAPLRRDDVLKLISSRPLAFAPGARQEYSNSGYYLLGMIVEARTRRPLWDALEEVASAPGRRPAVRHCARLDATQVVVGHTVDSLGRPRPRQPWGGSDLAFGATGLCATATALTEWAARLHGGEVLSHAGYLAMQTPVVLADGTRAELGFGQRIRASGGRRLVEHGGYAEGFQTLLVSIPSESLHVAVLANVAPSGGVETRLANAILDLISPPAAAAADATDAAPGAAGTNEWSARTGDDPAAAIHFRRMGDGHHVTSNVDALIERAEPSGPPPIAVSVALPVFPALAAPDAIGVALVSRGSDSRIELLLRRDIKVALIVRQDGTDVVEAPWTAIPSVVPRSLARLRLEASDSVRAFVNDSLLLTRPLPAALRDGVRGALRTVGSIDSHLLDLRVDTVLVRKGAARASQP